jgi:hypothetical protein
VLIMIVILGPVLEELTFRLILKPSKLNLSIGLSIIISYICRIVNMVSIENFYALILILLPCFIILFYSSKLLHKKFKQFILRNFKTLFYTSGILFALVHIRNFVIAKVWFVAPLIVLPQFIGGLMFGYVRLKYEIIFSIIFHAFENLVWLTHIKITESYGNCTPLKYIQSICDASSYTLSQTSLFWITELSFIGMGIWLVFIAVNIFFEEKLEEP